MAIALTRIRNFGRNTAGATAVEFALVALILFGLMFAIIEFGRAWWTKNALQYAVERAVRYAVICNGACPGDAAVQTYAANQVYDQSVGSGSFSVTHPAAGTTCVKYNFSYAPWFTGELGAMSGAMAMKGASCRSHS